MNKVKEFRAFINFTGKRARYDKSYVKGRVFQMAKFICTDEDGRENIIRIRPWKMKKGLTTEYVLSVRTSEKKFFDFLEMVDRTYPKLISEFDVSKTRK